MKRFLQRAARSSCQREMNRPRDVERSVHWLLLAVHGSHWTCSERALTKRGFSVHNYVHLGSPSAENSLSINELGTR